MDDFDRRLLDLLQTDFPIVNTPFAVLAERLGTDEKEVLQRTKDLLAEGLIRRFGVSADSRKLGFVSTLVAARVRQDRLDAVVAVINSFAEVTHNYERDAEFNVWFTVIARHERRRQEVLDAIRAADGVEELIDLPATHVFKINVQFRLSGKTGGACAPAPPPPEPAAGTQPLTADPMVLPLLRDLRDDLPVTSRPFAAVAARFGLTEDDVVARLQQLKAAGLVRKLGAFLRHRRVGYGANGMVVWKVAANRVEPVGRQLAAEARVTHAYARPASARWPYRLYTMLHGQSRDEVCAEAARIAVAVGLDDYRVIFSSRELKKSTPPLT